MGTGPNALDEPVMPLSELIISETLEISSLLRFKFVNLILAWGTFFTVF